MGALSNYAEQQCIKVFDHVAFQVAAVFCKLHVGSPGEDCTTNPATEVIRKAIVWDSGGAALGALTIEEDLVWVDVAADETFTHVSLWDDVDDGQGNPLWYGPITPNKVVNAGDTFTIVAGDLVISLD